MGPTPSTIATAVFAIGAAFLCSCAGEPADPEKIIIAPLPDAPAGSDGKHFLADKPLTTFDRSRSEQWTELEAIGSAKQRQKDYRDKHSVIVEPTTPDPFHGRPRSLAQAAEGLEGRGVLGAVIATTHGTLTCELLAENQEIGVAHFVGLALGTRPWWDAAGGRWRMEPFYRNLPIYRIEPGEAFYSGCPMAVGLAEVGFRTAPASPRDATSIAAPQTLGVLISKKTGTMGPQFVVTGGKESELRTPFVPIGRCEPAGEIERILGEEVAEEGLPVKDLVVIRVDISRGGAKAAGDGRQ
jgi:cyclophilin family peptidyl-prolyl cis-trans isomerase